MYGGTMNSTNADIETTKRLDGMFVGMLTNEEIDSFDRCVMDGIATRSYEGAGGFMGLAKVRVVHNERS
jgi:hypothetical protein